MRALLPRPSRALSRIALVAGTLALPMFLPAPATASPSGVKAVMIYNVLRFMAPPEPKAHTRLCVRRSEEIASDLSSLSGEPVGAGRLDVVLVGSLGDMGRNCDALYLGNSPAGAAGQPGHGQIIIGEGSRFAEDGGTVGLVSFGGQVRFAINARSAARSGVKVSSQLMRLAARIVN